MKKLSPTLVALSLAVLFVSLGAGSCESMQLRNYPPDFQQLSRAEIKSTMRTMAHHVSVLDETLRDASLPDDVRQQRVVASLDGIHDAANGLGGRGQATSHYMLDKLLPEFIRDVESARAAAAASPPAYFLAGSVAGSCTACHRVAR